MVLTVSVDDEIEELFSSKKMSLDTVNVIKKVQERDSKGEAVKYYKEALDLFGKVIYGKWDSR